LAGVYYIQLMEEHSKSKIPRGGDGFGGDGDDGDGDGDGGHGDGGDGGDDDGDEGDDWKQGVDRMHAVWEICFIL